MVFSGCLGGTDDNLEEETVEPVGETDLESLEKILKDGYEKANEIASKKIKKIHEIVGF